MKALYNLYILAIFGLLIVSCDKDEINEFQAESAINFVNDSIQYSFITEPADEYILEVPVAIIGDTVSYDRTFTAKIIDDELTTAPTELYELLEGTVPAGSFTGSLSVKLKKDPILETSSVAIHIGIEPSSDFIEGNYDTNSVKLIWTNKIVIPAWTYFRYFFTRYSSTAAYRAFIASTGMVSFTLNDYRALGPTGAQAMGKAFGDYVRQYEIDNGTPLLHDDGDHAGEEIIPIY
ncbi:DUF4843 domain-containing protein [Seonamhaeicola sp. NFXS20]|uniref:DUF4843 domain-containing protein n=1 Tax=Seonamhaeicola sp. NFXS20 TaxID=2816959 RepID=UPI003B8B6D55